MTNFFAGLGKRNNENNGQQNSGTNFFAGLNANETPYQRAVRRYNLQNNTAAAEDEPGFFAGLESGFAGVLGGQLHFGEANSPFGGETFGEAANYFDDIVQDNARSKFTNGAELSLDYLTDPQGLRYDMGNTIGSSAALGAETAAAMGLLSQTPVAGAAAAAAKVVPGLGKLWNSGILGKVAVGNVAGSGFEALSEGGNLVPELKEEGYSDEEIQDIANRAAALNIGGLTLSNLIQSYGAGKILGLLGGKTGSNIAKSGMALAGDLARRGTLAAGGGLITNAGEEGMQSAIGNIAKGEPIDWQEVEANAKTGAATGAIMGLGGGVGGGYLQNRALRRAQEQAAAEEENATGFNTIEKMRALEGKIPYEAPDGTNCMRTIGIALEGTPYEGQINVDQAITTARELALIAREALENKNFAELVSVEGVFRDVAVDGHVHDVVVAHHEHRALRRLRRVDARDEGLQRVRRALERRLRRYQMRGVLREVGQLFEPRAQPRAGRALFGALRDARYRDELFYH